MSRRRWLAGLGTALLLPLGLVGCKTTEFSFATMFQAPLGPEDQLVQGSPEVVVAQVKAKLEYLQLHTQIERDGQAYKIIVTRPDGQAFDVRLSRRKTDAGLEATQVQFFWRTMIDGNFQGHVKAHLSGQTPSQQ